MLKCEYKNSNFSVLYPIAIELQENQKAIIIYSFQTHDFQNLITNMLINNLNNVFLQTPQLVLDVMDFNSYLICQLWVFCFFNNYFYTGSKIYLQINGIGMCTSYSFKTANYLFYEFHYRINTTDDCFLSYEYIDYSCYILMVI